MLLQTMTVNSLISLTCAIFWMRIPSGYCTLSITGPGSIWHFPFVKKGAHDVVRALENYAFPVMALASMLHSDNGRELVNFNDWTGQVQLVSERPCHPQS